MLFIRGRVVLPDSKYYYWAARLRSETLAAASLFNLQLPLQLRERHGGLGPGLPSPLQLFQVGSEVMQQRGWVFAPSRRVLARLGASGAALPSAVISNLQSRLG